MTPGSSSLSRWVHRFTFLLTAALLLGAVTGHSQPTVPKARAGATAAQGSQPAAKKPRPIPFHGTLSTVNPTLRTLTVGKRTFILTGDTKIYRGENRMPGTLADAKVGGPVTGSYIKAEDGKLLARSVFFKTPPSEPAPATGSVTNSNRTAKS